MATMTQDDQLCALKAVCILLLLWKLADCNLYHSLYLALEYVFTAVPTLDLPLRNAERSDDGVDSKPLKDSRDAQLRDSAKPGFIQCYDPSTMQWLGQVRCMDDRDVDAAVRKAAKAQKVSVRPGHKALVWCQG